MLRWGRTHPALYLHQRRAWLPLKFPFSNFINISESTNGIISRLGPRQNCCICLWGNIFSFSFLPIFSSVGVLSGTSGVLLLQLYCYYHHYHQC